MNYDAVLVVMAAITVTGPGGAIAMFLRGGGTRGFRKYVARCLEAEYAALESKVSLIFTTTDEKKRMAVFSDAVAVVRHHTKTREDLERSVTRALIGFVLLFIVLGAAYFFHAALGMPRMVFGLVIAWAVILGWVIYVSMPLMGFLKANGWTKEAEEGGIQGLPHGEMTGLLAPPPVDVIGKGEAARVANEHKPGDPK